MPSTPDLTNQKFGKLTALEICEPQIYANSIAVRWLCICDCGNKIKVHSSRLRNGDTKSCGCWFRQFKRTGGRKHGHKRMGYNCSPEYRAWCNMIQRCENPNNPSYKHYGGRGITVAPELRSFDGFYAELGPKPKGLTLDRIDNNAPYAVGNVRWVTHIVNARNTRKNRFLTVNGETRTLSEWAEVTKLNIACIRNRLRRGWEPQRVVSI